MNEENIVGLSDIDKSLELDRYVPDLIDEEKEYYLKKYLNVDYFVFFDEFIKEQRVKNQMFIKDPISLLNEDEDFLKLWEKRDNLVQLVPEYFTNNNIKNFLTNHSTSVMFKQGSGCGGSVKILPMFFKENDIAFSPEGVYYKNYFIFLHPILFQLDLFWVDFLETYGKLHKNGVVFKICLDLNTMVSLDHYRRIELEKGILYGKPYSDDNLFEGNKEAYFTKLIRDEKVEKYQGNNITSTEFLIDQKNGSFEIEEIIAKDGIYINRYIHTLFDINTKNIIHFDGSLLTYNKDSYNNRKCTTLNKERIKADKQKIFRIDGELDLPTWKSLIQSFFIGNEMILEYFDKEGYENFLKEKVLNDDYGPFNEYLEGEEILKERLKTHPVEMHPVVRCLKK